MTTRRSGRGRRVAAAVPLILLLIAAIASLLPLIEANIWWIRLLDFPRLQLAAAMVILLFLYLVLQGRPGRVGMLVILLALVGLGCHASKLYPYLGLGPVPAVKLAECSSGSSLSVMVANVLKSNESADEFLEIATEADPDVLLVLETDAWWDERLAPLRERYAEVEQFLSEDHAAYGIHSFPSAPWSPLRRGSCSATSRPRSSPGLGLRMAV